MLCAARIWLILVVIRCSTCLCLHAAAEKGDLPFLTRVEQVRRLSIEESKRGYPVRLDAVVTYADLDWNMLFVQDPTGGIYVDPAGSKQVLRPGQRVELEGTTQPGGYRPSVKMTRLIPRNEDLLPAAPRFSLAHLLTGDEDCQWGEVEGVVRTAEDDGSRLKLSLTSEQGRLSAIILVIQDGSRTNLINSKVRLRGVCGSTFDDLRQLTGIVMLVPRMAEVTVEKAGAAWPIDPPRQAIGAVLQLKPAEIDGRRVRVEGSVTTIEPGKGFNLVDATGSVFVESGWNAEPEQGARLDVTGFVGTGKKQAYLQDASFHRTGVVSKGAMTSDAAKVLTSLQEVRQLSTAEATNGYPVRIHGIVTYHDPSWWNILFVQDATAGIYVNTGGQRLDLKPGDLVEMEGVTGPGEYAPVVTRPRIRTIAHTALPVASVSSFPELSSGCKDSLWVEVKGVVHSAAVREEHVFLDVVAENGRFEAMLPGICNGPPPLDLVDAAVRLRGVCGALFNQRRQLTGLEVYVPGIEFILTEESGPADPFSLPLRNISSLLQFSAEESAEHRVRVSGTVTLGKRDHSFYLQDDTGGVWVKTAQSAALAPGDQVEAVGFPSMGEVAPTLTDTIFRVTGQRPLPQPAAVTAKRSRNADWNHEVFDARRVRIRARLLDAVSQGLEKQLVLQDGSEIFSAIVGGNDPGGVVSSLRKGSLLELTGVCSVKVDQNRHPRFFEVQLKGPDAIRVLDSPSWWTPERAFGVTGAMVVVILTGSGFVVALRCRVRRQTEMIRQRLEREAALEERYRDLVENANDFIYTHDLEGNYTSINQAGLRLTGYTREEILTMKAAELVAPDYRALARQMFEQKLAHGGVTTYEVEYVVRDGHRIALEINSRLVYEGSKPVGIQGIARDITGRKRAEDELRKAKAAAEQASRTKSEFLANMSHEIRTPLNGVIGMTNLLLQTRLTAEQRDFVETARASGDVLLTVINDILDFSKIEAGKLHFETIDFDLTEVLEETVELLAERAQSKGLQLGSLIGPAAPRGVRGDPGRLRQVILNLTGNAIKFTERGEVFVEIASVEESAEEVLLRFEISDTGTGIAPEAQARLFQPFSQADSSTTRKYGGTGLGLVICKQLVERMGGEIGVRSAPGEGSTFWFTVRLEKQAAAHGPVKRDDLAGLRVLIVDDHPSKGKALSHRLHAWRVRNGLICAPGDAVNFLCGAAAEGTPYDCVVLDLQRPRQDGVRLIRAIQSVPALGGTRLVVLTQPNEGAFTPELAVGGIAAVLTKPPRPSMLYQCLARVRNKDGSTTIHFYRQRNQPGAGPASASAVPRGLRVLVAEDNAVNQKVAVCQLAKLGHSVVDVAANGLEVIAALQQSQYDVVLMDCQMPELDGYETTRRIRQFSVGDRGATSAAVHIVAVTANAMEGDRELCLAAGMDDYLAKPMRLEQLQAALAKVPLHRVAQVAGRSAVHPA